MKVPGILKNKYVLYVLLVIGIINVLGYISLQDYNSLALFVVLGLLSSYFSKNMAVNLLIAIVVTSFVSLNKFQEGFQEGHEKGEAESKADKAKTAAAAALKAAKEATKEDEDEEKADDHTHHKHAVEGDEKDAESIRGIHGECDPECVKGKEECKEGVCVLKKDGFKNNVPSSTPASIKGETDESIGD